MPVDHDEGGTQEGQESIVQRDEELPRVIDELNAAGWVEEEDEYDDDDVVAEYDDEEDDEEFEVVDVRPLIEGERTEYLMIDQESGETKEISEFAYETLKAIHAITPPRVAFYLGIGALVVIEIVEPPVLVAVGLGYEALRRWTPLVK